MSIEDLVAISRYYGSNPEYVVAGGGNTSFKQGATLFIKGSGASLADITGDGFVHMDRGRLAQIWEKSYPSHNAEREAAVLADLMASRKPGEEQKRPSVETLLHDILPFDFVVHTHPAVVNGLTCSVKGEKAVAELFGNDALWIPSTNPGYILSLAVKNAMTAYKAVQGRSPSIIFLQNHGVFVGADSIDGIKNLYQRIMDTIGARITEKPDFSNHTALYGASAEIASLIKELAEKTSLHHGWHVFFERNHEFIRVVQDRSAFYPVSGAFTPDHIVYAGSDPLFIEISAANSSNCTHVIENAWKNHYDKTKNIPKIIAVQNLGICGIGLTEKAARLALDLFTDTVKVAMYSQAFGGVCFMSRDKIDFINTWEVEQYRSKIARGA